MILIMLYGEYNVFAVNSLTPQLSVLGLAITSITYLSSSYANTELELDASVIKGQQDSSLEYQAKKSESSLKMPLTLRQTPQTINIITSTQIEDQQLTTVGKVLDQTPGMNRIEYGVSGACVTCSDFLVRGFKVQSYQLDGVNLSPALAGAMMEQNSAGYERVEVIKGATGLLSGAGYPNATVNLVRKRPTIEPSVNLSSSVGSWDTYRGQADIAGALNDEGNIRGRIVVNYQDNGSWLDRVKQHRTAAYGILEFDLSDATLLDVGFSYSKIKTNNGGVHSFRKLDSKTSEKTYYSRSDNASVDWAYSDIAITTYFADIKHDFNEDWQLNASIINAYLETDRIYGVLGTRKLIDGKGSITYGRQAETPQQIAIDLSLTGTYRAFEREHQVVFGTNALRSTSNDREYSGGSIENVPTAGWNGQIAKPDMAYKGIRNKETLRQHGFYAATRFKTTDHLALILGARVSDWHKKAEVNSSLSPLNNYSRKETGVVTPYAGVVYDVTENWATYASYTNIFNPQNYQTESGSYLDPEEGHTYEIGVKGSLLNDQLTLNVAFFQSDLDNLAVKDGDKETPAGYSAYKAVNGTRSKGYEISLAGEILPDWHINAGYSHSITKDKDGHRIKADMTPMDQVKLFTRYRLPNQFNKLTVGMGFTWQSNIHLMSSNKLQERNGRQDSYSLVSAMARYDISSNLNLSVNANNIFDKRYTLNASNHTYGEPRNLTATLNWTY